MPMEYHTKHRTLTAVEIASAKDGVVTHMQQIAILDGELAEQKKKYANLLKPHKTTVKELMGMITTGVESGSAYCNVVVDPVTQTVKFFETKRVFNEDTQRHENVETLFDEKTFEEVGEKQLSIWQEESQEDAIESALDRVDPDEHNSLEAMLEDAEHSIDIYSVLEVFAKPFPAELASWYLSLTGSPSSIVNVTFANQGPREAIRVLQADAKVGLGNQTVEGHQLAIAQLGEKLFSDLDVDGAALLHDLITWANIEEGDDDEDESGDDE